MRLFGRRLAEGDGSAAEAKCGAAKPMAVMVATFSRNARRVTDGISLIGIECFAASYRPMAGWAGFA